MKLRSELSRCSCSSATPSPPGRQDFLMDCGRWPCPANRGILPLDRAPQPLEEASYDASAARSPVSNRGHRPERRLVATLWAREVRPGHTGRPIHPATGPRSYRRSRSKMRSQYQDCFPSSLSSLRTVAAAATRASSSRRSLIIGA